MRSCDQLLEAISAGQVFEYLFFWGHRPGHGGSIGKSCFSQWFVAPFEHAGRRYPTAEHFMMVHKAELFGDEPTMAEILKTEEPGKAKALGRRVKGFDEAIWVQHRWDIVVAANLHKFGQNPALMKYLTQTGSKILVEASPVDAIWGIGLAADSPLALDPKQWKGLNLLGFALMEVRDRLSSSPPAKE